MRTLHRWHNPLRQKHKQTLDRNRRSTTTLHTRKLPANLPRPLKSSSKPPKPRHPPKTQRHQNPHRLHQNLRRPHRPRHPSNAPSSQNRIHHPRPNLHRKINVRPNRRNPKRKPRPTNPHNLHPLRRTTPNLRIPKPNLEHLTTAVIPAPLRHSCNYPRHSCESRNPRVDAWPGFPPLAGEMSEGQRGPSPSRSARGREQTKRDRRGCPPRRKNPLTNQPMFEYNQS